MKTKTAPVLEIKSLKESGEFEGYGSTFGGEPDDRLLQSLKVYA